VRSPAPSPGPRAARSPVRPTHAVEALRPYVGVPRNGGSAHADDPELKLDANEAAAPPSPLVFEQIHALLSGTGLNRYPDPTAGELRRQLAAYTGRPASQIRVFNGSDSAIDYVVRTYVARGDHVLICAPCYDNARVFAHSLGGRVEEVFARDPFTVDVANLVAHISPATRLVYLCNPNNPTGRLYDPDQVARVLDALTDGVLIVDEAYFEYCGVTVAHLVDHHPHLVVVRSFSKAFGLAGLRCGYVLAGDGVTACLDRVRNIKDVNAVAQVAAAAALQDVGYMRAQVARTREARRWLVDAVRAMGIEAVDTPANFVMLRVDDPSALVQALADQAVAVRDRSSLPQLAQYLRVTVGTLDECRRFVEAVARVWPETESRRRLAGG
jgi:histidinol-phosphate aminotransferase